MSQDNKQPDPMRRLLIAFLCICFVFSIGAQMLRVHSGRQHNIFNGDGFFYYSYLPNLFFQGNLDFSQAYDRYWGGKPMWSRIVPETGRWSNVWSIGPALMWSPGFLLGDIAWRIAHALGRTGPTDGFDLYHEWGAGLASIFWSLLAVYLTYRLLRQAASPKAALAATIIIWIATPLLAYGFLEIDMSHGVGACAGTALILATLAAYRQPQNTWRWLGCGALAGLAMLIRPQHIVLVILPLGAWLLSLRNADATDTRRPITKFAQLGLMGIAAAIAFLPQMLAWHAIFGHYLAVVQPNYFSAQPNHPHLLEVLFSTNRGYFTWTPFWALALVGLFWVPGNLRWLTGLVVIALVLQIMMSGWAFDWYGGEAFGARRLIELGAGVGLGLAALFTRISARRPRIALGAFIFVLVYWNLALMGRYYLHDFSHLQAPTLAELVLKTLEFPLKVFTYL
jgi:hypothetical protein